MTVASQCSSTLGCFRAVGYINVDSCVTGDILGGRASPALKQVFVNAMKGVKTQNRDRWLGLYFQIIKIHIK